MWVTVNHKCNFRCRWCYAEHTKFIGQDMPLALAKELIDFAKALGLPQVSIIGGEPTLYPHLFEINDYARGIGINTILVTNGERFSNDVFWEEYQKHPNDVIGFSVKSGNPQQHKLVTKTLLFENVKKALTRVTASKIRTDVSFVHSTLSVDNFLEIVKMIKSCGVNFILVSFCGPTFEGGKASSLYMIPFKTLATKMMEDYDEARAIMNGKIQYATQVPLCIFPFEFIEKMIEDSSFSNTCQITESMGVVFTPDGSLAVCNHLTAYPIGKFGVDFKTPEELVEFQNSEKIRRYYDSFRCYPGEECKTCSMWNVCAGGCPWNWTVHNPGEVVRPFTKEVKFGRIFDAVAHDS